MKDHWNDFQKRWHLLDAPLRPTRDAVDVIVAAVGEQPSNVLLLGVTPELVLPLAIGRLPWFRRDNIEIDDLHIAAFALDA